MNDICLSNGELVLIANVWGILWVLIGIGVGRRR
jgi:hypothetical protein